jgi:hypothetical protein
MCRKACRSPWSTAVRLAGFRLKLKFFDSGWRNVQISNLFKICPMVFEFHTDGRTDGLEELSSCSAGFWTHLKWPDVKVMSDWLHFPHCIWEQVSFSVGRPATVTYVALLRTLIPFVWAPEAVWMYSHPLAKNRVPVIFTDLSIRIRSALSIGHGRYFSILFNSIHIEALNLGLFGDTLGLGPIQRRMLPT